MACHVAVDLFRKRSRQPTKVERCIAEIIDQLRKGILRPAMKLGEESFARKMKMERPPVRVAFELLVSMGVLERIHRAGTFVRKIGLDEFCEMMDVRAALEGVAARLASRRVTGEELKELISFADQADSFEGRIKELRHSDWPEVLSLEMRFHDRLVALSRNRILSQILASQQLSRITFELGLSFRPHMLLDPRKIPRHREIVRALEARDPVRAEKLARDHILLSRDQLIEVATGTGSR
jgi:DNA-binding GntR family transcriptional regulator